MNVPNNYKIYNASAGSGKTFTLVAAYLKILFKSDSLYSFKNILAITFTNKAAAEMKMRILESLKDFSKDEILNNENHLFNKICSELNVEPSYIQKKSIKILKTILNNYAAFNITTIDSFTYKLIQSFAFDLGIALNFEVEMDAISLLNEAVDVLIANIGEDENLTKTLIDYSISKANEDKSWDISIDLKNIAKLLLNENDIFHVNNIKQKSISDFIELQKNINKQIKETEKKFAVIGKQGIELIDDLQINYKDFYYSQLPKFFLNLLNKNVKIDFSTDKSLGKSILNEVFYTKNKPQDTKNDIDSILPSLLDLYYETKQLYQNYALNKLIGKSLIPLAILRTINNVLTNIKEENNIRLISEFNQLISKHLKEQPAAFIYEKIGERFRHYFIDEMQDTSTMQWENMIPLLDNVLSSENEKGELGSLLLVGDAKQAIYRWRGGKAEQFIDLSTEGGNTFLVKKSIEQLDTNWRSYEEVINFNNSFFSFIANYLKKEDYNNLYALGNQQKSNHKKGGYVSLQFIENGFSADKKLEIYPEKVLDIINNVSNEFDKKDICVLTRTRKQGVAVAEYLTKNNIDIISSETLLLQNNTKVRYIIDVLKYINQLNDKEIQFEITYFLYHHLNIQTDKHSFLESCLALDDFDFFNHLNNFNVEFDLKYFNNLSLYDSVEYIIRNFRLTETSDAYLQFFLDLVLDFSIKKSEGADAFLNYWEEKKEKLSIVVSSEKNAVNIMTIHKSKGLEFPIVIYPFDLDIYKEINPMVWYPLDEEKYNGFNSSLISFNKNIKEFGEIGALIYKTRREELELDNINLLYVALTRAKEQLYIISELKNESDEPQHYSQFFQKFLKEKGLWNESNTYHFGSPKRLSIKQLSNQDNIEQQKFISSDWRQQNITIAPKQVEDSTEDARIFGNLIHGILANIYTHKDANQVITSFINQGLITSNNKEKVINYINKVITNKHLNSYFSKEYTIINEREMINDKGEFLIPDRLVFKNNNVIIIDYKTGKPEKKHHHQINSYAFVLENLNYQVTKKLLVYINDEINIITVD